MASPSGATMGIRLASPQHSESPSRLPPEPLPVEQAILRAVAYADVFDYPLQVSEIHRYLHHAVASLETTAIALARASTPGGALRQRDGFYTLRGREGLVEVRRRRAAWARQLWPVAARYGHLIAGLPFVRMVAVTGSLAWDNVKDAADVDYLIVTEPGRVWLCRWLVAALVRVARANGVSLCPNYVVSKRALSLPEPNLYAAYELARMTPIAGLGMYRRMRQLNAWSETYLPNALEPPRAPVGTVPIGGRRAKVLMRLSRLGERTLRSPVGTVLEACEMAYRIRKRRNQGDAWGEAAYSVDWYRGHVSGHRQRALAAFTERLRSLGDGGS